MVGIIMSSFPMLFTPFLRLVLQRSNVQQYLEVAVANIGLAVVKYHYHA